MFRRKMDSAKPVQPWLRRRQRWLRFLLLFMLLFIAGLIGLRQARQHRLHTAQVMEQEIQQIFAHTQPPAIAPPLVINSELPPSQFPVTGEDILSMLKELGNMERLWLDADAAGCEIDMFHWWLLDTDECSLLKDYLEEQEVVLNQLLEMLQSDIQPTEIVELFRDFEESEDYAAFFNLLSVIRLRIAVSLSEGDGEEALRFLMASLRFSEIVEALPLSFPGFVEKYSFYHVEHNIIAVLSSGQCTVEQLQELAAWYSPEQPFLQHEMRDWHAIALSIYDDPESLIHILGEGPLEKYVPGLGKLMLNTSGIIGWNDLDKPLYMAYTQQAAAMMELPYPVRLEAAEVYFESLNASPLNGFRLSTILADNYPRQVYREARDVVSRYATQTAIAVEHYRQTYGAPPVSLEMLVPNFMEKLPIDPFNGETLRYLLEGNGYILYSVGVDRVDNGGIRPESRFDPFRDEILPGDIVMSIPHAP